MNDVVAKMNEKTRNMEITVGKLKAVVDPEGDDCARLTLSGYGSPRDVSLLGGRLQGGAQRWSDHEFFDVAFECDHVAHGSPSMDAADVTRTKTAILLRVKDPSGMDLIELTVKTWKLANFKFVFDAPMDLRELAFIGRALWDVGLACMRESLGLPSLDVAFATLDRLCETSADSRDVDSQDVEE